MTILPRSWSIVHNMYRINKAAEALLLVHQDVKPVNILLTRSGVVKVIDFGLAKALALAGEPEGKGQQCLLVSAVHHGLSEQK
jgi:serine/threonine protein kinase